VGFAYKQVKYAVCNRAHATHRISTKVRQYDRIWALSRKQEKLRRDENNGKEREREGERDRGERGRERGRERERDRGERERGWERKAKKKTRPETRDRDRESGEMQRSHHKETMRLTMCNDLYLVRHLIKCVPKRDDGTCLIVFEKHVLRMASVGKSGKCISAIGPW